MRRGRLWLGAAGLALALLIAGVWLVPGMLDWSRYRQGIAALAAQRLGRPVRIGGAITLHLLPQPILTASDVSVDDAGDGVGLRARALRLRVALGPLLAGNVDTRELTLQGAEVRLPWPPPAGALGQRFPSWVTGLQARIEEGRLQVGGLVLTDVDATLATDPDTGTLSVAGTGQTAPTPAGPRSWQFTARLARPGRDGAAALDLSLDGLGKLRDTGGTFSGAIGHDGALTGRVAGRGPDLSALMPAPAVPWRGDGRLSASGGLAVADELALEIGGAPARGAVALRVTPAARLDLAVAAGRLDLDAWLPALLARNPNTIRAGLPTGIDLSAEGATLAGGTLRRLRAAVDIEGGTILLREVSAILPGEATLTLSGDVAQPQGAPAPRFDGAVRLAAPDLRATLRWAQPYLPQGLASLPPGVLRAADLAAHVTAAATALSVADLRGTLDGAALAGTASLRTQGSPPRPTLAAALTLDRLPLDPWLPDPAPLAAPGTFPNVLAALRGVDADIRLQARDTAWLGARLGPAMLELQSDASRVLLRRFEAQPLGMTLTASGQVSDSGRVTDGRLDISAPDLAVLQPLAAALPPGWAGAAILARGPGALAIQAAGPPEAIAARVLLESGDLRIEAKPAINVPGRRWAGPLTLHHPGAPRLLERLGIGGTAAWLGDGSLSLVGQASAAPGRIELDGATLAAGALRAAGRMALEGNRLTGQVAAESLPLPLVYPRSPDPLPLAWLGAWQAAIRLDAAQVLVGLSPVLQSASADITLDAGTLQLAHIAGRAAGGTITGAATLAARADPPRITVQGAAINLGVAGALFETPLDLAAGAVSAALDLTAAGHSPAALLATIDGRATLRIVDGVATGLDLAAATAALATADPQEAAATARTALLGGTTAFQAIDATLGLARGIVRLDASLVGLAGTAAAAGTLDVPGATLDLQLDLHPASPDAPAMGLRVTGPANAPVRVPELSRLARWLAERR